MTYITDIIAFLCGGTSRPASRHLSIVVIVGVLLGATACGPSTPTSTRAATSSPIASSTTSVLDSTPSTLPVPSTVTATTAPRPTGMIDELVGDAGAQVHVRCVGQGDTTVVLIAGFGGDSTIWALVEPAIAARARVCSALSAVVRTLPEGLTADEVVRLTHAWDDGQQQWARLSTDSRVVPVENTGHHIELDQPDIVIDEITHLLA